MGYERSQPGRHFLLHLYITSLSVLGCWPGCPRDGKGALPTYEMLLGATGPCLAAVGSQIFLRSHWGPEAIEMGASLSKLIHPNWTPFTLSCSHTSWVYRRQLKDVGKHLSWQYLWEVKTSTRHSLALRPLRKRAYTVQEILSFLWPHFQIKPVMTIVDFFIGLCYPFNQMLQLFM